MLPPLHLIIMVTGSLFGTGEHHHTKGDKKGDEGKGKKGCEEDEKERKASEIKQVIMKAALATMVSEGRISSEGTGATSAVDEMKDHEWSEHWAKHGLIIV